jgi:class 3 adenylate cyclase
VRQRAVLRERTAGARKLVSILFVDVVGSTARGHGADPEDVRDRNQSYLEALDLAR